MPYEQEIPGWDYLDIPSIHDVPWRPPLPPDDGKDFIEEHLREMEKKRKNDLRDQILEEFERQRRCPEPGAKPYDPEFCERLWEDCTQQAIDDRDECRQVWGDDSPLCESGYNQDMERCKSGYDYCINKG